jgi:predicted acylesterase/phospholipase RssA/CRP-like cAMP-binding protein
LQTIRRSFGVQDQADVDSILSELAPVTCPGGEWLFHAGDPGDSLYLIERGRLQVFAAPEVEEDGRAPSAPRFLGELGPGEIVGEVGLLTGGERSASVRAIRDTKLLRMDRAAFDHLAVTHPPLAIEMAAQIARRLRDRTSGGSNRARGPENIVVLPLADPGLARPFDDEFVTALEKAGRVRRLDADSPPRSDEASIGEWIDAEAARHDYLVLEADAEMTPWSRICLRHADVVLCIADADSPPDTGAFAEATRRGAGAARRILVLVHRAAKVANGALWRTALDPDAVHHVRLAHHERDVARLARILTGRAIGLVLGGGAARGFAHVGAYRALVEAGIDIDWVGGTSIGSVFAAMIALDWTPAQAEAIARSAFVEENPLGDYTLPLVALLRGRRVQRLVKEHFGSDIEDLPIPYYCVSSHLERGEIQVHEQGPLWSAIRASVALPGVLPPAVVGGELSIDGGILNNLPVDVMRARGVGQVIAVDLSLREDAMLRFEEIPGPLQILRNWFIPSRRRKPLPSILSLLVKASMGASASHTRAMREQADLLLQPPVAPYGLLDVKNFDVLVEVGYDHVRARLADWKPAAVAEDEFA